MNDLRFIRIIILVLFLCCCSEKQNQDSQQASEMNSQSPKGSTSKQTIMSKKISTYYFSESFGEFIEDFWDYKVEEYDISGNMMRETDYEVEKEQKTDALIITGVKKNQYNDNGDLTIFETYNADGSLSTSGLFKYDYDDRNFMTVKYQYTGKGTLWRGMRYEYNSSGNKINQTRYYVGEGGVTEENLDVVYHYDDGRMISKDIYDDGEVIQRHEYEYDLNGNQIKEYWYAPVDSLFYMFHKEFDENNNLVTRITSVRGELRNVYRFKYDEFNRKVYESVGSTLNTIYQFETSTYNDNNDVILISKYKYRDVFGKTEDYPEKVVRIEYEYHPL